VEVELELEDDVDTLKKRKGWLGIAFFYSGGVQGAEGLVSHVAFRQGTIREESGSAQGSHSFVPVTPGFNREYSPSTPCTHLGAHPTSRRWSLSKKRRHVGPNPEIEIPTLPGKNMTYVILS
jgi:hypothetical protein